MQLFTHAVVGGRPSSRGMERVLVDAPRFAHACQASERKRSGVRRMPSPLFTLVRKTQCLLLYHSILRFWKCSLFLKRFPMCYSMFIAWATEAMCCKSLSSWCSFECPLSKAVIIAIASDFFSFLGRSRGHDSVEVLV